MRSRDRNGRAALHADALRPRLRVAGLATCIAACTALALSVGAAGAALPGAGVDVPEGGFGIGRAPTPAEIAGWDIAIAPDGANLPSGTGSVAKGRELFAAKCVACHGADGEGKPADRLVGGQGSLAAKAPIKTIGSFWPYATTIFDYVRRAMPLDRPQSLSADEVYALTAFLLNRNGIVPDDASLDAASLIAVRMPNRDGFVTGPDEPDVKAERCMKDCR